MNVMLVSVAVWTGNASGDMGPATRELMHWLAALIGLPAILWCGLPFYRSALAALRAGRTNMDVPISLGVLLTAAMSLSETIRGGPYTYFDSARARPMPCGRVSVCWSRRASVSASMASC